MITLTLETPTLNELLKIPNYKVYDEHPYIAYDRVQELINAEYGEREIAFETPDLFRRKFNYYLAIRAPVYNKMLESQLMEIDPFMTEYIVTQGINKVSQEDKQKQHVSDSGVRTDDNYAVTDSTKDNTLKNVTDDSHSQENVNTEFTGRLYSRAENVARDTVTDVKTNSQTDTDYNETKDSTENGTTNKTGNTETTNNQTGRQWTEKGNTEGHTLTVHSDTPQAMLFNQPAYLTGAGREHTEGYVTDGQFHHVAESDPNQFDTAQISVNSPVSVNEAQAPWYQYASNGDNNTGHDSYNKEGTETYQISGTNNSTENTTSETTANVSTDGNKNETTNATQNTTVNDLNSTSENTNEHSKRDGNGKEQYIGKEVSDLTGNETGTTKNTLNARRKDDRNIKTDTTGNTNKFTDNSEIRKGRTMRSPSQLLKDYRATLNYNADMWLISELEPLFLGLW